MDDTPTLPFFHEFIYSFENDGRGHRSTMYIYVTYTDVCFEKSDTLRKNMNRCDIRLLDLPDELLFIILKKLNNIDVLYSLLDANNGLLDILAQEKIFSNILNFVSIDSISSIDHYKLDRFSSDILPRINHNVKSFTVEPISMERILLAANYPNLTELTLFNFEQKIVSYYLTSKYNNRQIMVHRTDYITFR